jgi:hypothetical protein
LVDLPVRGRGRQRDRRVPVGLTGAGKVSVRWDFLRRMPTITPLQSGYYRLKLRRVGGAWKIVHREIAEVLSVRP